jgi:glycerol-3-phosphate acyltransferase PlsX
MNIALDVMGGDNAPVSVIEGAVLAKKEILQADENLILIGDENIIKQELARLGASADDFMIIHADEQIGMDEHPTKAISQKSKTSIHYGYGLLKQGKADVFCSAGNTGAMLVGAMFTIKAVEGVIRPGIASFFPRESLQYGLCIDVGANADCKPDVLAQFADMGSIYYKHVFGVEEPKVGLINLGEEESKGTLLTTPAHQLIKLNQNINFIGNVEGGSVFTEKADVLVCDGFTGNVLLKTGESFYEIMSRRGLTDDYVDMFNYESVGGSPILGVNGNVIIGHGKSTPKAIKNMIKLSSQTARSNVAQEIKSFFKAL